MIRELDAMKPKAESVKNKSDLLSSSDANRDPTSSRLAEVSPRKTPETLTTVDSLCFLSLIQCNVSPETTIDLS